MHAAGRRLTPELSRQLADEYAAIPALLACSGLHHHLTRNGTRTKDSLVVESGEPREVQHFALLIGYGADLINPYLALQTVRHMITTGDIQGDPTIASKHFLKANLNGVINNAGLGGESALEDMTNDAWDLVMDVTLNGAMKIMRAAIPVLKDTQGVIVNNASVLGWRAQAGQSHYAAAKAGVMALTRCVALETVDYGIRINAVAPSLAMNPHLSKTSSDELIAELESKEAFGRGAEPWEIANIILFLASDLSSYMTGEVISASSQRS